MGKKFWSQIKPRTMGEGFRHTAIVVIVFLFSFALPYWLGVNFNMNNIPPIIINLVFAFLLSCLIWLIWFAKDEEQIESKNKSKMHLKIDSKDMVHIKFPDMDAKQIEAYFDGLTKLAEQFNKTVELKNEKDAIEKKDNPT